MGREHRLPGPKGGSAALTAATCKCDWVKVTDRQPDSMPPVSPLQVGLSHPPIESVIVPPLGDQGSLRHWPAADNRPPPPDRARNLPLLL